MLLKTIKQQNYKTVFTAAALVFIFFLGYYVLLLFRHTPSDIQAHAGIAYAYVNNNDKLFPNFLYFFLVAVFAGFSANMYAYYAASVILICIAITAKYIITQQYLKKHIDGTGYQMSVYTVLAVMMLFVFALPAVNFFTNHQYYYGLLPPNVWHNSTVIFLMPFSILLFFKSYQLLFSEKPAERRLLIQVFLLVILNAFIKPSFLFTIIPAVFLFFTWQKISGKIATPFYLLVLPYLAGLAVIVIEYYLIFKQGHISSTVNSNTGAAVVIAPFSVWKYYSPNIFVSFITSAFFPLVYILFTKGRVVRNKMVSFSLLNYAGAVAVWVLFAEEGSRKYDANFCWQAIIASYLLFLTLLIQFVKDRGSKKISQWQQYIIGGAFLLHFVWGVFYWVKIIIFKSYV